MSVCGLGGGGRVGERLNGCVLVGNFVVVFVVGLSTYSYKR